MYAKRFSDGPRFRPASLAVALAINAGIIAMILLAKPDLIPGIKPKPPIETYTVVEPTPPPPDPKPQPEQRTSPQPRPSSVPTTPDPIIKVPTNTENQLTGTTNVIYPPATGDGPVTLDPPYVPPPLPFVGARQDPRYLGQFQPTYPDADRDAGNEGVVRLRVLIGIDGRVKQVQPVSGRESFLRAATAQALAKWRFKPATRGDVPEESWMVMTVRFTLDS